jgi:hypothetical protein
MAPMPPEAPGAPLAPPPPLAPLAALPSPAAPGIPAVDADCEFDGMAYRTSSRERSTPVRMHSSTVGELRICASVRGPRSADDAFLPTGRLSEGVSVTLAASGPDGTQRLEITAGNGGNAHRWFVNGQERTFDRDAEEWRDAMFALIGASMEKGRIRGNEARLRGEIARAQGQAARLEGRIAQLRGAMAVERADVMVASRQRQAEVEARSANVIAQQERRLVEQRARNDAVIAEVEARRAEVEARVARGPGRNSVDVARSSGNARYGRRWRPAPARTSGASARFATRSPRPTWPDG